MTLAFTQKPLTRVCEVCGKEVLQDYAWSLHASWVTTGHPGISAFNCDQEVGQHWGCCMEHAEEALITCIQEHMRPLLLVKHEEVKEIKNASNTDTI